MSQANHRRRADTRAEARRRARMAARGEVTEPEQPEDSADQEPQRPNLLRRLFPTVPPLPGRPDPLTGFNEGGPLRPIRVRIFLLRTNLFAWIVPGIASGAAFYFSLFLADQAIGLFGTFLFFATLIVAGWIGWQRPTLYGTAAAVLGYLVTMSYILWEFSQLGVTPADMPSGASGAIFELVLRGMYQAAFGFLGGWYGGYLRRRNAQVSSDAAKRRRGGR